MTNDLEIAALNRLQEKLNAIDDIETLSAKHGGAPITAVLKLHVKRES